MKIKFDNQQQPVNRVVEPYEWNKSNGFLCDVTDAGLIENLLTSPGEQFTVAEDDPILKIAGIDQAVCAMLAGQGIASAAELALVADRAEALAEAMKLDVETVKGWALAARQQIGQ